MHTPRPLSQLLWEEGCGWAGLLVKRSFLRRLRREGGRKAHTYTYVGQVGRLGLGVVEGQVLFAVGGIGHTVGAVFWDARIEQTSWPFPAARAKKAYSQFSFLSWASEQASA